MSDARQRFTPSPAQMQREYNFGIHFNNVPPGTENQMLEELFQDMGAGGVELVRDPRKPYGWVGFSTMNECNEAFNYLRLNNHVGLQYRKGPYEAQPYSPTNMNIGYAPRPSFRGMVGGFRQRRPPTRVIPDLPFFNPYPVYEDDYGYEEMMEYDMYPGSYDDCEVGPCIVCARTTSYTCSRCCAFYCSQKCQRIDWNEHRTICNEDIPPLNYGTRRSGGQGDMGNLESRMQALPLDDSHPRPVHRADIASVASSQRKMEGAGIGQRTPEKPKSELDSERPTVRTDRRQDLNRNEDRRSNEGQRRDEPSDRRRQDSAFGRRDNADRGDSGFGRRDNVERSNDNGFGRRDNAERRNDGGFGRRDDNASGRRDNAERSNDNGFGRRDNAERRNDGGFGRRDNGFGRRDDNAGQERRPDRRQNDERRNDNGFGDRRQKDEQRRSDNGFDRNRDGPDRWQSGGRRDDDRRASGGDRRNFNAQKSGEGQPRFGNRGSDDRPDPLEPADPPKAAAQAAVSAGLVPAGIKLDLTKTSPAANEGALLAEQGVHIQLKNNDKVLISNAARTDSIHLIPSPIQEEFKLLVQELNKHCKTAPALSQEPKMNEVVACQFELDNMFYRATVKKVLPMGVYEMEFCDYGNIQRNKIDKLRAIPDKLKMFPRNAMQVALRGVQGAPLTAETAAIIGDLSDQEVVLKLQFDGAISNGVELLKSDGVSVNKMINSLLTPATPEQKPAAVPEKKSETISAIPTISAPAPAVTPQANVPSSVSAQPIVTEKPRSSQVVLSSLLQKVSSLSSTAQKPSLPGADGVCLTVKNGDTVIVNCCNGTDCVFITPVTEEVKGFAAVTHTLKKHCESAAPIGREPVLNEMVACRFDADGEYYRAVVEEVLPGGKYKVQFVDFGNSEASKADDIREISDELKKFPRCAVKVYFRDVASVPANGQIALSLGELCEGDQYKICFDGSISNGVELIKPNGQSVNEELNKLIKQIKPASAANTAAPTAAPAAPTAAPAAQPAAPVAPAVQPVEPVAPAVPAAPAAPVEVLSPVPSYPYPNDEAFALLVTGIIEPFHVAGCSSPEHVGIFETTVSPKISQYCQSNPEPHTPIEGEMCLALYEGEWYRALALSSVGNGKFNVFFVDYGNNSEVEPKDIRKITQEFRIHPLLATLCRIIVPDVPETPDNWTKIEAFLNPSLQQEGGKLFPKVTAKMTGDSTADVTIPELKVLFN